ncbi:MAG: CinA family protein [Hyphomicrobiaceae bacterium]
MFPAPLVAEAERLLADLRQRGLKLATAESCTGGLIVAVLTEIAHASEVVDRGFVTYTNDAKMEMLGVSGQNLGAFGAVSREVAIAMAEGALVHSSADLTIAVTGLAGPGGGTALKPVGLVHLAAARLGAKTAHQECRFGSLNRSDIRLKSIEAALALVRLAMDPSLEAGAE